MILHKIYWPKKLEVRDIYYLKNAQYSKTRLLICVVHRTSLQDSLLQNTKLQNMVEKRKYI